MKMKPAGILVIAGTSLATLLRFIQMTFFFDYQTGFSTDDGVLTLAYGLVSVLTALSSGLFCMFDRSLRGKLVEKGNAPIGLTALLSAVFLLLCGAVLLMDFFSWRQTGVTYFVPPAHVMAHLPFAALTVLFGAVQLWAAVGWLRGRVRSNRLGGLWAAAVAWGLCYMILTFMVYSASATTAENLFTVGGGALLLLFLLQAGKLYAGLGGEKTVRNLYMFGLPAMSLWLTYVLSNSVVIVAGKGYDSELPYAIQLSMLVLAVHIAVLLWTFRRRNFAPAPEREREPEHRRLRRR